MIISVRLSFSAGQIVIDPLDIQAAVSLPQGGALLQSGNGLLHKCHGGSLESLPAPDCFPEFCPVMRASPAGALLTEGMLPIAPCKIHVRNHF